MEAFQYDAEGAPHRYLALEKRLDYADAYGRSVNAALGVVPEPAPWWRRAWAILP